MVFLEIALITAMGLNGAVHAYFGDQQPKQLWNFWRKFQSLQDYVSEFVLQIQSHQNAKQSRAANPALQEKMSPGLKKDQNLRQVLIICIFKWLFHASGHTLPSLYREEKPLNSN